jgi:hypothetical protein
MVAKRERKSKPQPSGVDKILSRLPAACAQEFKDWCWHQPSYSDMSNRLNQYIDEHPEAFEGLVEGEDYSRNVSINACFLWYSRQYPIGDEVKEFNKTLRLYQGIEVEKIPQQLLIKLVRITESAIEKMTDESLAGADSNTVLTSIPGFIREIRSLSKMAITQARVATLHEDRMQAVNIAIMAIMATFKDQAGEEAIKAAAIDAMFAAEDWSKRNLD